MKNSLLLNGILLLFIIFGSGFTIIENESINSILTIVASIIAIIWIILILAIGFKVIQQWKNLF